MNEPARMRRWQAFTVASLFVGYTGYYLCRSNLSVVSVLLMDPERGPGLDEKAIGLVASLGVGAYTVGKFINGVQTDFLGGRVMFLLGMALSVCCTVCLGFWSGLTLFAALWIINRYVQSMGWGALVQLSSRWFRPQSQASVLGVLSMSYLLGDAAVKWYLGGFVKRGYGWQDVFFIAALTLGGIMLLCAAFLRNRPGDVGLPEPKPPAENVFGDADSTGEPASLGALLRPFLVSSTFWLVCLMNVGLTFIREAFNFWTPAYLKQAVGLEPGDAAQWSMIFPLVGAASSLVGGFLSSRLRGRHGLVMVPSLIALVAALALLAITPVAGRVILALALLSAVAFLLLGPYTFCSGVMAVDLGGTRGSSTAAGLIDCAGYLGATLSGYGVAVVVTGYGWEGAFVVMAVIAGFTAVAAGVYLFRKRISNC